MCGIHGIISLSGAPIPGGADTLAQMGRVTQHRGPDDEGRLVAPGVAMGMRRLSIIDLSGGHQPISNHDDTLWVVCNGEIYNFRELRDRLIAKGHRFKTKSDTEVVLYAYAEYGDDFVHHLDGMFGFAIWDARRQRALIGRDSLGIKPIYYYQDSDRLIFASESKAILEVPGVQAALDRSALVEYLNLGYVPAPASIFENIKKLPVATVMIVENGQVRQQRYWRLPSQINESLSEDQWAEAVRSSVERAVVSQMVSDVPLGAFLSGGIDSSAVVAFMAKHSKAPVKTYSIGFDTGSAGSFYNELPFAKIVAEQFKTQHREIVVRPDVVSLLPQLLWHLDEPMADSAFITTYLVSQFARQDVTVILSGVGGDELFGGYRRYQGELYGKYLDLIPSTVRKNVVSPLARRLPADRHSTLLNYSRLARSFLLSHELPFEQRYWSYVGVFGQEGIERLTGRSGGPQALARAFAEVGPGDPLHTMFAVDLETQLPDDLLLLTDKMSMATSLECRVPLLDRGLVELAARMPSRYKIRGTTLKHILKRAFAGLLPDQILHRKKRGFGAPMGAWIKHELASLTDALLAPAVVKGRGWFDHQVVAETLAQHRSNQADHTDHVLALLNLEVWARLYLDRRSPADVAAEIKAEVRS